MDDEVARRTAAHDRLVIAHAKLSAAQLAAELCRPKAGEYISQEFYVANRVWEAAAKEYSQSLANYVGLPVAAE